MFSKKIILLALVAFATFSSCKKDDAADNAALLTTGKWKLIAETEAGKDTYTAKAACDKDDFISFTSDGKGVSDEGPLKCSASDPQTTPFTWVFSNTEKTQLVVTQSGFPLTFTIIELTSSTLKMSFLNPFTATTFIQTLGR
jgi:Lipocalin-like domain